VSEKERIVLDADVIGVIERRAFRARLGNGHVFVAFVPRERLPVSARVYRPGDRVCVRMSPFDMSQGEIVEFKSKGVEEV
jgi:translation initiation factor IF-1